MVKVAFLALCTVALVGILEWAVVGSSGNESRHRIEPLIPGGVTTLAAAWTVATLWTVVSWFRVPSSPIPGLVILGLYVLLLLYLHEWARRVAVPTNGGISPRFGSISPAGSALRMRSVSRSASAWPPVSSGGSAVDDGYTRRRVKSTGAGRNL